MEALGELRGASVLKNAKPLDQQPRIALLRLQQLRLFGGEQQRAHQPAEGLAHRDARDAEIARAIALRRQGIVRN